ncbi:MAG TPA: replicative DNA helicase [Candidatus Paceibacterota bacterium]|nr:replicative DNA helicase [Candidatus Paceibacterota bacterium]
MIQTPLMAKTSPLSNLRIPPHHLESEQAVLGALMLRPSAIHDITDILIPEMFYAKKHATIYQTILDLSNKGEPIDVLSVAAKLKEKKAIADIGGNTYLNELMKNVPSTVNIRHYAEIVYKKFVLRSLIDASEQIANLAYEDTELDAATILDTAEKNIFRISSTLNVKNAFISIKQSLVEAWEQIEHLHEHKDELRGVPTGFPDLDNLTAGLQKSDLVILAARPSMGKTTFALDIARNVALANIPVGIFSLEMSAQQLVQRMLSAESRVDAWSIRTGHGLSSQHFTTLQEAASRLQKAPIYIDDQAGNSIVKMRSVARRLKAEHGLGLIIVDYLQLMSTSKNYDSMVNQVTEISRSLKQLARELDVPVLALSQLSRAVESRGGKPRLSDLRDSGSIEQDADLVMFIHREDRYKEQAEKDNIVEILVEKHRNGPVGVIKLLFDAKTTTLLPIDKSHAGMKAMSLDDF